MVHASLHWTERVSDDLSLWSFEVKSSVQVYNRVPDVWSGLSPLVLLPGSVFDDLFETMNSNGVDEPIIESICQDLFRLNRELYTVKELNDAGNIIYQPPPSAP